MSIELARTFVIENEWYWRITENASSFTASAAVRDFLEPLARVAKGRFELAELAANDDARTIEFRVNTSTTHVELATGGDRAVVNGFIGDVKLAVDVKTDGRQAVALSVQLWDLV